MEFNPSASPGKAWRFNLRPSNTEPLVRLNIEATDKRFLDNFLKKIYSPEIKVITLEDPIEYSIEGIEQIQVHPHAGLTFAAGLRSILRQDPNVIMVGEIRDEETAGIAINAALTGHLLLTTLHTNDAATTLPRLADMGVEPFLVASTVNIAIGQRLVRKICSNCKEKKELTADQLKSATEAVRPEILGKSPVFYTGKGCDKCSDSGYKGRIGIYEVLEIDDEIREAIMKRVDSGEIRKIAIKNGMKPLNYQAVDFLKQGVTTLEEAYPILISAEEAFSLP